jgi:hypothetical protein
LTLQLSEMADENRKMQSEHGKLRQEFDKLMLSLKDHPRIISNNP